MEEVRWCYTRKVLHVWEALSLLMKSRRYSLVGGFNQEAGDSSKQVSETTLAVNWSNCYIYMQYIFDSMFFETLYLCGIEIGEVSAQLWREWIWHAEGSKTLISCNSIHLWYLSTDAAHGSSERLGECTYKLCAVNQVLTEEFKVASVNRKLMLAIFDSSQIRSSLVDRPR